MIVFAALDKDGNIIPETIGPHRRSAMVNWLYTFGRVGVHAGFTDKRIVEAWEQKAAPFGVKIAQCDVLAIAIVGTEGDIAERK